jgi:Domain of unknown function (DUF4261)
MSNFITYIAMERDVFVSLEQLARRYAELYPSAADQIDTENGSSLIEPGQSLVLTLSGLIITVMFLAAPLPEDALNDALASDMVWPEAKSALKKMRSHAIVAALNEPSDHASALKAASTVTMVSNALASLLPTLAVISDEGQTIVSPDRFMTETLGLSAGSLPVSLWTSMIFQREQHDVDGNPRLSVMTNGLRPFIGRELEFYATTLNPYEAASRVIGLCQYLIINGLVINDGDSVGMTEAENIKAIYRAEGVRVGIPIIRLEDQIQFAASTVERVTADGT